MPKKIDRWTKEKIMLNQQVLRHLMLKDFDKMRECAKTHKEQEKLERLPE